MQGIVNQISVRLSIMPVRCSSTIAKIVTVSWKGARSSGYNILMRLLLFKLGTFFMKEPASALPIAPTSCSQSVPGLAMHRGPLVTSVHFCNPTARREKVRKRKVRVRSIIKDNFLICLQPGGTNTMMLAYHKNTNRHFNLMLIHLMEVLPQRMDHLYSMVHLHSMDHHHPMDHMPINLNHTTRQIPIKFLFRGEFYLLSPKMHSAQQRPQQM